MLLHHQHRLPLPVQLRVDEHEPGDQPVRRHLQQQLAAPEVQHVRCVVAVAAVPVQVRVLDCLARHPAYDLRSIQQAHHVAAGRTLLREPASAYAMRFPSLRFGIPRRCPGSRTIACTTVISWCTKRSCDPCVRLGLHFDGDIAPAPRNRGTPTLRSSTRPRHAQRE